MEFVIVAPLYFALLGGVFYVGELALNRMRLAVGDHTGTWLGASRFTPDGAQIGGMLGDVLFKDTLEPVGTINVERSSDGKKLNYYMALYKGGIERLEISLPMWAKGMLRMQDAAFGGDTADLADKDGYTYMEGATDHFRSYSFHRYASSAWPATHNRAAPAKELVMKGILANVVTDVWIGCPDAKTNEAQMPDQPDKGDLRSRSLSEWAR